MRTASANRQSSLGTRAKPKRSDLKQEECACARIKACFKREEHIARVVRMKTEHQTDDKGLEDGNEALAEVSADGIVI